MSLEKVSTLSMTYMAISAVISILVPVAVIIIMGVKKKIRWKALLFGALLFVVAVLVLESILHRVVLGSDPVNSPIYKNVILYMLYGGFAAGIFEETARLLGFKFLLRVRENESIDTGISYGLGHGGIEAIILGGFTALSNLMVSYMANSGALNAAAGAIQGEQGQVLEQTVSTLAQTPSGLYLVSGVERMIALVLQVSLSLFVLKAVKEKKWMYFVTAVLLHAGVDMFAVLYQRGVISNIYVIEGVILLFTAAVAIAAFRISKGKPVPPSDGIANESNGNEL